MAYSGGELPSRPQDADYEARLGLVPRDVIEEYDRVNGTNYAASYGQNAQNQAQGAQSSGVGDLTAPVGVAGSGNDPQDMSPLNANGFRTSSGNVSGQGQLSNSSGMSAGGVNPFAGDLSGINQSAYTNLGNMPGLVNGQFSDNTISQYGGNTDYFANKLSNLYGGIAPAQAAQIDLSQIPQAQAQQAQGFDALNFLLSGQGFDPKTLAAMNAGVTDNAAAAGRSARGSANLMAEQNGLSGSPAAMALRAAADRNQGAATQQGLNQVQIQNAQQGMQNLTTGAGMQNQMNLSNAQQANMMALQNMNAIIQGMNTNVANSQQANMANYAGQQHSADTQANFLTSSGQNLNQAMLNKQTNADNTNANNQNAWAINQGNLDQNNNQFNTNVDENRWKTSLDALTQLANGSGSQGVDYTQLGNSDVVAQTPNQSAIGNTLTNAGNNVLANQVKTV